MANKKPKSLEDVIQNKLNSSHISRKVVKTADGLTLFDKSESQTYDKKGQSVENSEKELDHLSCGHEYRGQATVRNQENPELIYCERCFSRCYRCKRAMLISRTYPLGGHLYCLRHFLSTLLYIIWCFIARCFKSLLIWTDRLG